LLFGSLGTMLNVGSPTYGPSKAALEALSAIMAKDLNGTGVTVNVLVPGGITNTPMVSDHAAFDLARLRCCRKSHRSALSRYPLGYRESDFPHRHFFALQPLIIGAKGWSAALPR
jgi:NAD(P)-dependent dehydrogenase (short-subunit alcohol dehydrogenase family)